MYKEDIFLFYLVWNYSTFEELNYYINMEIMKRGRCWFFSISIFPRDFFFFWKGKLDREEIPRNIRRINFLLVCVP